MSTETFRMAEQYEAVGVIPRGVVINPVVYDGFHNREQHLENAQNCLRAESAAYVVFKGEDEVRHAAPLIRQTMQRSKFGNFGPLSDEKIDRWLELFSSFEEPRVYAFIGHDGYPMAIQSTFWANGSMDNRIRPWAGWPGYDYKDAVYCNSTMVDPKFQGNGLAIALRMLLRQRMQRTLDTTGGERSCLISMITLLNTFSEGAARATGSVPISGVFYSENEEIPRFDRLTIGMRYWGGNVYPSRITEQYQPEKLEIQARQSEWQPSPAQTAVATIALQPRKVIVRERPSLLSDEYYWCC